MNRYSTVLVLLLLFVSIGAFAQQPYDSEVGVTVMRANGAALGALRAAQSDEDFLAAAGALSVLAHSSFVLLQYSPPQGSPDEWERIHSELIETALRGIQACAEQNAEGLSQAVALMGQYSRQGHGQFR